MSKNNSNTDSSTRVVRKMLTFFHIVTKSEHFTDGPDAHRWRGVNLSVKLLFALLLTRTKVCGRLLLEYMRGLGGFV